MMLNDEAVRTELYTLISHAVHPVGMVVPDAAILSVNIMSYEVAELKSAAPDRLTVAAPVKLAELMEIATVPRT
jgi:hypothetical protein